MQMSATNELKMRIYRKDPTDITTAVNLAMTERIALRTENPCNETDMEIDEQRFRYRTDLHSRHHDAQNYRDPSQYKQIHAYDIKTNAKSRVNPIDPQAIALPIIAACDHKENE